MLCYVLWVGAGELLVGEKDVLRRQLRWFGKRHYYSFEGRPCSRGWNDMSIDGIYGEGM
jgi:hypothetical protein